MRVQQRNQLLVRAVLLSLWLPAGIVLVSVMASVVRNDSLPDSGGGFTTWIWPLLAAWPAAIPLTLAVLRIQRRSQTMAWLCALPLGALSILLAIGGGLLGPAGIIIYTALASIPAWLTLGLLALLSGRGRRR